VAHFSSWPWLAAFFVALPSRLAVRTLRRISRSTRWRSKRSSRFSYDRWRTYNVEDSLRFFGVRLHEIGMIKANPNKLIAQGTDWRFLNELKRELKA
jgi:hypothetical protein